MLTIWLYFKKATGSHLLLSKSALSTSLDIPIGSLFTFDVVAFHALFGLLVTADPVIVKVNQMRDNKIIWTGNVRVMLAQKM